MKRRHFRIAKAEMDAATIALVLELTGQTTDPVVRMLAAWVERQALVYPRAQVQVFVGRNSLGLARAVQVVMLRSETAFHEWLKTRVSR